MYIRVVLGDASLRLTLGLESTYIVCGSAFAITCQASPYWLGLRHPFIRWVPYLHFLLKELRDPQPQVAYCVYLDHRLDLVDVGIRPILSQSF